MLLWPPVNMIKAKRFAEFFYFRRLQSYCVAPAVQHGHGCNISFSLCSGRVLGCGSMRLQICLPRILTLFLAVCTESPGSSGWDRVQTQEPAPLPYVWESVGPLASWTSGRRRWQWHLSQSPASFQLIPSHKLLLCWEIISSACNFAG